MPLTPAEAAALNRLLTFYEGNQPYDAAMNPGGFRDGGHLINFVPSLEDVGLALQGVGRMAQEVAASAVAVAGDAQEAADAVAQALAVYGSIAAVSAAVAAAQQAKTDAEALVNGNTLVKRAGDQTIEGYKQFLAGLVALGINVDRDGNRAVNFRTAIGVLRGSIVHDQAGARFVFQLYDTAGTFVRELSLTQAGAILWGGQQVWHAGTFDPGSKFDKAGGQITGDVTIAKASPAVRLFYAGVALFRMIIGGDGRIYFQYNDGDVTPLILDYGGNVTTGQFGDLNNRIESRAAAYADGAKNTAQTYSDNRLEGRGAEIAGYYAKLQGDDARQAAVTYADRVSNQRFVHAGDSNATQSANGSLQTFYPGAQVTELGSQLYAPSSLYYYMVARYRYLQSMDVNGNWRTVGWAS